MKLKAKNLYLMLALTKKLSFWHYLTEFTLASQSVSFLDFYLVFIFQSGFWLQRL